MKELMQRFAMITFLFALSMSATTIQAVAGGKGKAQCKSGETKAACDKRVQAEINAEVKKSSSKKGTLSAPPGAGKSSNKTGTLPAPPGLTQVDSGQWRTVTLNGVAYDVTIDIGPTRDHYQIVWEDKILKYLLAGGDPKNPQFCEALGQFSAEGRAVYLDTVNKNFVDAANANCGNNPYMRAPAGPGVNATQYPTFPGDQTKSCQEQVMEAIQGLEGCDQINKALEFSCLSAEKRAELLALKAEKCSQNTESSALDHECIGWVADYNKSAVSAENHQQTCELAQKIQEKKACKKYVSDDDAYIIAAKYQTCAAEGYIVESWRLDQFVYKCDQTDIPGDVCNFASKPLKYGSKGLTYYVLPACQLLGNSSDPCMIMDKIGFDNYADRGSFNGALGTGSGLLDGPVQPGAGAGNPTLGPGNQLAPGQDDFTGAITVVGPDNTFNLGQIFGSGAGGVWPTPIVFLTQIF